ncbi:ATP-grasp domain-containing protein [Nocardia panacis]|uniref:ATP-grasp domain-containing protein n=1 Tax=Nocardia panacis TaxID=2340916 RepID=A0A3A4KCY1_9NOCA|nr:ATP-grasp domain-containing protein [Nocardia panacis]RJO70695.1 ATP-grasp domain-containing protein [Nocardia panacis]
MSTRPVLVLVDALSTGALLARHAAAEYRLVHVRSRQALPAVFAASLPSELFVADLVYPSRADDVVSLLAEYDPVAVIPASEFGIEAADEIAWKLGLRGNDPALSGIRRDKYLMLEAVAAAGLRTARQYTSSDVEAVLQWRRCAGLDRIVVKPLDSAGSDDVFICATDAEVRAAAASILGKTNLMLRTNAVALAQEYLVGEEYIVNSVSRDGEHWCTDVWISRKRTSADGRRIYDFEDLVSPRDPWLPELLEYVRGCLDALGVVNGPAHTELIRTALGPMLLETGARLSGLANPAALDRCTGVNQVDLTLDCYAGGGRALAARAAVYDRAEPARCVNLIARRELPFPRAELAAALARLPAFESARFRFAQAQPTRPTVDLNSSPGVVFLVHPDPEVIRSSYRALRQLEHQLL